MDLGERWNHVVRGDVSQGHYHSIHQPTSKTPPQPVKEAPEHPIVTVTREMARPQKPESKFPAGPKRVAEHSKKKAATSVKTVAAKPTTPNLVVPTQSSTSPLDEISVSSITFTSQHVCC